MLNLVGFKEVILKSVKVVEKDGKPSYAFVNFVDIKSYDSTNDLIFLSEDKDFSLYSLEALQGLKVVADIKMGSFNGKPSLSCVKITKL